MTGLFYVQVLCQMAWFSYFTRVLFVCLASCLLVESNRMVYYEVACAELLRLKPRSSGSCEKQQAKVRVLQTSDGFFLASAFFFLHCEPLGPARS